MQVDHVIPLNGWSEQGTVTVDNMLPVCFLMIRQPPRSTHDVNDIHATKHINNILFISFLIFIFFLIVANLEI